MRMKLIVLDKKNIKIMNAEYDIEKRIATTLPPSFFSFKKKKFMPTKYLINPDHIYYMQTIRGLKPCAIVDVATRTSKSPEEPEGISVRLHSDGELDEELANRLDYLTERTFWNALMLRLRLPFATILLCMLAGAGVYAVIRMILGACGLHVP